MAEAAYAVSAPRRLNKQLAPLSRDNRLVEESGMPLILRPTDLASPFDRDRIDYLVIDDGREVGRIYEDRYVPAAAQVSAAIALLDRAWGKPHQALEVGINRASFDEMSDDELLSIVNGADGDQKLITSTN
jgi:hypothetical protein